MRMQAICERRMKPGDLVRCDPWVYEGKYGIVLDVQNIEYCPGAFILLNGGDIKLIRLENLKVVDGN